jgi:methionyl aminopeptidase
MIDVTIHSEEDFIGMRKAGKLAAEVLDYITEFVAPDTTTETLNDLCHNMITENGAISAPLNYKGFPKSICTSINHVICHGIPGPRKLKEGDIVNIDVTVILNGYYGDSSRMYFVGKKISTKAQLLVKATYEAMMYGIDQIKPGANITQIGKTIQNYAEKRGFSVVRDFCGHGIGKVFHTSPSILHYYDPDYSLLMEEGMFFTVEPMINAGRYDVKILPDGWTAVTKDHSLSAQFEHTIGATKDGVEIFTLSPKGLTMPPYK